MVPCAGDHSGCCGVIGDVMARSAFDRAIHFAYDQASRVGDIRKLPVVLRTVVVCESAQGIIGNGGFRYFFENDFPGKPSYSLFVQAFLSIGATDAATVISKAVSLFPFPRPHLSSKKRNDFLDRFPNDGPFKRLNRQFWDDKSIESLLKAYVRRHSSDFHDNSSPKRMRKRQAGL